MRTAKGKIATEIIAITAQIIHTLVSEVNVSSIYTVGATIKTCTKFLFVSHVFTVHAGPWIERCGFLFLFLGRTLL